MRPINKTGKAKKRVCEEEEESGKGKRRRGEEKKEKRKMEGKRSPF